MTSLAGILTPVTLLLCSYYYVSSFHVITTVCGTVTWQRDLHVFLFTDVFTDKVCYIELCLIMCYRLTLIIIAAT